jgi:hypothetical protein
MIGHYDCETFIVQATGCKVEGFKHLTSKLPSALPAAGPKLALQSQPKGPAAPEQYNKSRTLKFPFH